MAERTYGDVPRQLAWATYGLALIFLIEPVLDLATNFWPMSWGSVDWRYGLVGVASNYVLTPLSGLLFAFLGAALLRHWGVARVVAIVAAVGLLLLLIAIISFSLDVIQLRRVVKLENALTFEVGALKAGVKLAIGAVYLAVVAAAAWKVALQGRPRQMAPHDAPLIVKKGA